MHKMTKTTFVVKTDETTAMKYVIRAEDEATKNHKANKNDIVTGTSPPWLIRNIALYEASLCIQKPFILLLKNSGKLLSSTYFLLMVKRFGMIPAMLATILLIAPCQNWPKVVDSHKKVTPTIA
jgi:hypothetical protein